MTEPATLADDIAAEVSTVLVGMDDLVKQLTISLLTRGHVLLVDRFNGAPTRGPDDIEAVVSPADVLDAREAVTDIHVEDVVKDYILELVTASRDHPDVAHGASPRGSLALLQTAKAYAAIQGQAYVISDDVKAMVKPVLQQRLVLTIDIELSDACIGD